MKTKLLKIALLVFGVLAIAAAMADPRRAEASGKLAVGAMLLAGYELAQVRAARKGQVEPLTKAPRQKAGALPGRQ